MVRWNEPWGVSFFNEHIVVSNQENVKTVFYDTSGNYIKEWDFSNITDKLYGNFVKDDNIYIAAGDFVIKTDFDGEVIEKLGEGIVSGVTSVVVDSESNVVVAEPYNRKIKVLKKN
ncbi:MAG: hypothetical protein GY816_21360 [Cytophagales bacterium]|nr:hypothetical protein [Cytophagales bacterium]